MYQMFLLDQCIHQLCLNEYSILLLFDFCSDSTVYMVTQMVVHAFYLLLTHKDETSKVCYTYDFDIV